VPAIGLNALLVFFSVALLVAVVVRLMGERRLRRGAESEAQAAEQRFRAALRTAPVYVFQQDTGLRYTWISRLPAGLSASDVIGRRDADLIHDPAVVESLDAAKRRVLATGAGERRDLEIPFQGMTYHVDLTLEPVRDAANRVTCLSGVAVDVTDHARAMRQIEEWQWRFESAVRASRQVIYDRDLETGDVLWGGSVRRVLEREEPEIGTMDSWRRIIHPEDVSQFDEALERSRLAGSSFHLEYRARGDGRWIDLEDHGSFIQRDHGSPARLIGSIANISLRRQAQRDLQHQSYVTRVMTENAASALYLLDENGRPTYSNPAAQTLTGHTLHEMKGRSAHDVLHHAGSGAPTADRCPVARALASRRALRDHEEIIARRDGTLRYGAMSVAPLERDGRPAGFVMEVRDITPQTMAEQQLRSLNETLEQRVEERTKVAEQRAAQLRALATELTQAEQRERRRLAQNLHDQLQQLLVAAKLQLEMARNSTTGGGRPAVALQRADALLNEAVEASRTLAVELSPPILEDSGLSGALEWLGRWMREKHGLQVAVRADHGLDPAAEETKILLFDAARELLFNVVKHARTDRASVELTGAGEERIALRITDQGSGFDAGSQQKATGQVRGFGLFNMRQRLEILGGRLEVTSQPGKGATVTLTVPRAAVKTQRAEAVAAMAETTAAATGGDGHADRRKAGVPGRAIRVLVADDHQIVRQGLIGLLEAEPDIVVVGEAAHGLEAVERSRALHPDVIVMDVNMPKMNGIEATRHIARHSPRVSVIALSLYKQADMAQTLRDAGASAYLTKDGPSDKLIEAIRATRTSPSMRPGAGH
jgi:PAS domain S-box-containing protein